MKTLLGLTLALGLTQGAHTVQLTRRLPRRLCEVASPSSIFAGYRGRTSLDHTDHLRTTRTTRVAPRRHEVQRKCIATMCGSCSNGLLAARVRRILQRPSNLSRMHSKTTLESSRERAVERGCTAARAPDEIVRASSLHGSGTLEGPDTPNFSKCPKCSRHRHTRVGDASVTLPRDASQVCFAFGAVLWVGCEFSFWWVL